MNKIAIVILNYNGEHFLNQFLPIFIKHSKPYPIYVADNASTDGSLSLLSEKFPDVFVIRLEKNLGYAGGYNEALKQVHAEYYAIVNSDIEVTSNWLSPILTFLETNVQYVAAQPKIRQQKNKEYFEYAGASGGFIDLLGYPYCRGRIFNELEKDEGQYDDPTEVLWTSGACFIIRSEAFHQINGFDPDFFAHMEEIDLCWRLHRNHSQMICLPESVVYHVGGGTLSSENPKKTYLNFRNGLSLLIKNLSILQFYKIPIRIVLDWIAAIKFLLDNNPKHAVAVLKAHLDFSLSVLKDFNKRSGNYKKNTYKSLTKTNSIVWSRFIGQKRKFSDL